MQKNGDILVISYIGFRNQELPAASDMKITLVEDAEILDDVIVIGYATGRSAYGFWSYSTGWT